MTFASILKQDVTGASENTDYSARFLTQPELPGGVTPSCTDSRPCLCHTEPPLTRMTFPSSMGLEHRRISSRSDPEAATCHCPFRDKHEDCHDRSLWLPRPCHHPTHSCSLSTWLYSRTPCTFQTGPCFARATSLCTRHVSPSPFWAVHQVAVKAPRCGVPVHLSRPVPLVLSADQGARMLGPCSCRRSST